MPNWVTNFIELEGDEKRIAEMKESIKKEPPEFSGGFLYLIISSAFFVKKYQCYEFYTN